MTALRPFFLVACVAFAIGFVGYLAVGRLAEGGPVMAAAAPQAAVVSAPSSDDWNFSKKI